MLSNLGAPLQLGIVVRDIEAGMQLWADQFGVGGFALMPDVLLRDASYRGRPVTPRLAVALSFRGDTMVELIQPLDETPSPFTDFLAAGREGLQHFGFWPLDMARAQAECAALGWREQYAAVTSGRGPTLFYEDPGGIGAMIELIEGGAAKLESYEPIRRQAAAWRPGMPAWTLREGW